MSPRHKSGITKLTRFLIPIILAMYPFAGFGQSLIVGIPSPDTTPKHSFMLTHESQFARKEPDNSLGWNSFSFVTYGLDDSTELSLSLNNLSAPKMSNLSLGPGIKKVFPLFRESAPKSEFKWTVGTTLPLSLQGQGVVGNWSYSTLSTRLPKTRTRFTAGISGGTQQLFGRDTIHAIVGVEQPLTKRLSLVADWYSGTHDLGAIIPALQINFSQHDALIIGAKIPNNRRVGDPGIIIELNKFIH